MTPLVAVPLVQVIAVNPPHPNAAKVLSEFSFSLPVEQFFVNGALVDRKGVQDTTKVRSEAWFVPPDPAKLWNYTPDDINASLEEVRSKWNSFFKK